MICVSVNRDFFMAFSVHGSLRRRTLVLHEATEGDAYNRFVSSLAARALLWIQVDGGEIGEVQKIALAESARLRDVQIGPDGFIWVLTDGADAKLLRFNSAKLDAQQR